MRIVDATLRYATANLGLGIRWLKQELAARDVTVRLCAACLAELLADADAASWRRSPAERRQEAYLPRVRREIAARAEFVRLWTCSDERIDPADGGRAGLVRIARKYALPRPWKVPEPVASECRRPLPNYWTWAGGAAAMPGA